MRESFNKISSSVSAVIGGNDSKIGQPGNPIGRSSGAAGTRGPGIGRGAGRGIGRGRSQGGSVGPGRGTGRPPKRPYTPGANTPLASSKPTPQKQTPSAAKAKQKTKKQKQKKVKDSGAVSANAMNKTLLLSFLLEWR